MKKSILEGLAITLIIVAWIALVVFAVNLENKAWTTVICIGSIVFAYGLLQMYACSKLYKKFKQHYGYIRNANKKRTLGIFADDFNKVQKYTDWIDSKGEELLDIRDVLNKNMFFFHKRKLKQMSNHVERMMNWLCKHPYV